MTIQSTKTAIFSYNFLFSYLIFLNFGVLGIDKKTNYFVELPFRFFREQILLFLLPTELQSVIKMIVLLWDQGVHCFYKILYTSMKCRILIEKGFQREQCMLKEPVLAKTSFFISNIFILQYIQLLNNYLLTGAFGYFEVTHDITKYSKAKVFSQIGKRTPIVVRFSTVGGESGSADTVRYA